jgi:hypothetical protein
VDRFEFVEDMKVNDRIIDSTIRFSSGCNDRSSELFSSFEESFVDLSLIPVSHRAEHSTECGFRSFEIWNVEGIFNSLPVADEERSLDVERCEDTFPVEIVASAAEKTHYVGSH